MTPDETPKPVPPPTGLVAWLFDRDERVRRVLWTLYPAYGVTMVALLAMGRNAALISAATAAGQMAVAMVAHRRRINRSQYEDLQPRSESPGGPGESTGRGELAGDDHQ